MSVFFTPHARARALERYGIELTAADMREILRATKDGRAQMMQRGRTGDGVEGRIFVFTFKGKTLLPVLAADQDFILTFVPIDHFLKGNDFKKRLTQRHRNYQNAAIEGRPYKRPKSNRRGLTDVEE